MIQLLQSPAGVRAAIVCESCGEPITAAAAAVVVRWATRSALVSHTGACLEALRLQYPSTSRRPAMPLVEAIGHLVEIRDAHPDAPAL